MGAQGTQNRQMFWCIVRRLLNANRGRLFVILLALGAGAAVTSALLNLQVDAKRRISTEFRAFGANVVVTSIATASPDSSALLDANVFQRIAILHSHDRVAAGAFLYFASTVRRDGAGSAAPLRAIVAGYQVTDENLGRIVPFKSIEGEGSITIDSEACDLGQKLAATLQAHHGDLLYLKTMLAEQKCYVGEILSFGGPEDNQIFLDLSYAQALAVLPGRISLVALSVPGTPQSVEHYVVELRRQLPGTNISLVRQFTEGEARIYNRISGLLTATVVIVLLLTSLCVMAAMTNVAMERRNDVGLMKAIGGATRRVLRLFIMEAALLGLAGGVIGAAAGIFLSIWLGKQVFGVAAQPRLIVYPVAVALTVIVAILSAYPLRRLASIRPASVFRGEA
jgi:ABC-type lipoprotein release transport system permease subunit